MRLPPVYAVQFVWVVWHPKSHPDYIDLKFAVLAYKFPVPSKNFPIQLRREIG